MQYRTLGKTGIKVSRLCFGSLTVGPCQADLNADAAGEIIAYALSLGVNFIDTAQLYKTYPHIRRGLELAGCPDAVIASKTYAYTAETARAAVDEARKELNRDYIDIFLLHEQESEHTLAGHKDALDELYRLKSLGSVGAVGISTHRIAGVRAAVNANLDVVFPLLNIKGVGIGDGTAAEMDAAARDAADAGLGVYLMKVFGGGHLLTDTSRCLDYALTRDYAASIAIGMQSASEVTANACYFQNGYFTEDIAEILQKTPRRLIIEDHCVGCGNCVAACGQGALQVINGKAVCAAEKCVTCGYCGAACPETALKII